MSDYLNYQIKQINRNSNLGSGSAAEKQDARDKALQALGPTIEKLLRERRSSIEQERKNIERERVEFGTIMFALTGRSLAESGDDIQYQTVLAASEREISVPVNFTQLESFWNQLTLDDGLSNYLQKLLNRVRALDTAAH